MTAGAAFGAGVATRFCACRCIGSYRMAMPSRWNSRGRPPPPVAVSPRCPSRSSSGATARRSSLDACSSNRYWFPGGWPRADESPSGQLTHSRSGALSERLCLTGLGARAATIQYVVLLQISSFWHNQCVPDVRTPLAPDDLAALIRRQQEEIAQLRNALTRAEHERDRLKRRNERLGDQPDAARRAGFRQAAPFAKPHRQGTGRPPGRRASATCGRHSTCPSRIRCQAATGSWTKSRQWET